MHQNAGQTFSSQKKHLFIGGVIYQSKKKNFVFTDELMTLVFGSVFKKVSFFYPAVVV